MQVTLVIGGVAYPLEGVPPDLVIEHGRYRLRLEEERPDVDVDQYRAEAGEVPLPLATVRVVGGQVVLEWEWAPDFFTGEFTFTISYKGTRIFPEDGAAHRVHVQPSLHKLTRDDYEAMLTDLIQWSSGWMTPSPGEHQGTSATRPADSPLAQLELLRRSWPNVERLVEEVLHRPRRRLVERTVGAPLHRARTVTSGQWQQVLSQPALWTRQPAPRPAPLARVHARAGGILPSELPQQAAYSTLAVPENVFLVTLLTDLRRTLVKAIDLLQGRGGAPSDPQGMATERRLAQARMMLKRVSGWLRSTWLSELEPAPGRTVPTPALLKHPIYGTLWRFYLQWRRAVTLVDGSGRPLPLDRTYQLYEYWCLLMVVRAVAQHLGEDQDQASAAALARKGAELRLSLEPGKSQTIYEAKGVTVTYQRSFQYDPDRAAVYSYSHRQIPDITIQWLGPDGMPRLLLFDPKYRVSHEGILNGLSDMHRYRDAIVARDGRRAVQGGFLLCPAAPKEPGDQRYLMEDYRDRWGFGICRLSPGGGAEHIQRLLNRYLCSPDVPDMRD